MQHRNPRPDTIFVEVSNDQTKGAIYFDVATKFRKTETFRTYSRTWCKLVDILGRSNTIFQSPIKPHYWLNGVRLYCIRFHHHSAQSFNSVEIIVHQHFKGGRHIPLFRNATFHSHCSTGGTLNFDTIFLLSTGVELRTILWFYSLHISLHFPFLPVVRQISFVYPISKNFLLKNTERAWRCILSEKFRLLFIFDTVRRPISFRPFIMSCRDILLGV